MSTNQPLVIGIGEVLWDLLPKGKQLGGAPANFTYHARIQGARALLISAIGADELGQEVQARLAKLQLDPAFVQIHGKLPTGTVSVAVSPSGEAGYTIHENVAWDCISWDENMTQLALEADAICFGTLAQRSFISRSTIQALLQHAHPECLKVLDLNLREGFWNEQTIIRSLELANVLKLNEGEWMTISRLLGLPGDLETGLPALMAKFDLQLVAMTRGPRGSLLVTPDQVDAQPAHPVTVVDTVGAGDSFTAALVAGLLRGLPLSEVHARASALAAFVCTQGGATPTIPARLR